MLCEPRAQKGSGWAPTAGPTWSSWTASPTRWTPRGAGRRPWRCSRAGSSPSARTPTSASSPVPRPRSWTCTAGSSCRDSRTRTYTRWVVGWTW